VHDEAVLAASLQRGIQALNAGCKHVLLLGISPDDADPDLGYILPGSVRAGGLSLVVGFVEKPDAGRARSLVKSGALWNAFIVMAHADQLLQLFARKYPQIVANMKKAVEQDIESPDKPDATTVLYRTLINIDFSRDLLAGEESALCVLPVGRCGWSDIGTPQRLAQILQGLPMLQRSAPAPAASTSSDSSFPAAGFLNLADSMRDWRQPLRLSLQSRL
jgi:mannose-1-phosphate guanylyltransferase